MAIKYALIKQMRSPSLSMVTGVALLLLLFFFAFHILPDESK